jgi:hypothetical protein
MLSPSRIYEMDLFFQEYFDGYETSKAKSLERLRRIGSGRRAV